jgi:hypothetical protein
VFAPVPHLARDSKENLWQQAINHTIFTVTPANTAFFLARMAIIVEPASFPDLRSSA